MEPVPLVVVQSIRPLVAFRERVGAPLPRLPTPLGIATASIPLAFAGRLWEEVALAVGQQNVGLSAGAASRFEDVPLGQHVRSSLTIGAGLAAAARASSRFCGGQRLWLEHRGGDVCVRRRFPDALRRGRRQANDFALQVLIDFVRRGAGPDWRPAELHLEGSPPAHGEEIAALATHSARFGAAAETLVFPRSVLALPLPPAVGSASPGPPSLPTVDFADSIRHAIRSLLELGELTLPNVAEAAGTSVRSLQRRLAASGLSFARLIDEARFQAASRLLRDPAVRIVDVSAELGYTDAANFTRAFRRWTGVPPLAFRRGIHLGLEAGVK